MNGQVNIGGGLSEFFGDGSDGAFNPNLAAMTTAPNGGTVANLFDMNTGTVFTTGTLVAASDRVIIQIDFGSPQYLKVCQLWQALISTGASRLLEWSYSTDGVTWTATGAQTSVTTAATDRTTDALGLAFRYWRLSLKAGGSDCTFTCQGITLNYASGDTQTAKVWRIVHPSILNGPAIVKQFSSLTLPAGYELTVENPCQGLIIYCQGNATFNGTIEMTGKGGTLGNNLPPIPILKKKSNGDKVLDKYNQLISSRLEKITGGAGGAGGGSLGFSPAGRILQGGFGGPGRGGGTGNQSVAPIYNSQDGVYDTAAEAIGGMRGGDGQFSVNTTQGGKGSNPSYGGRKSAGGAGAGGGGGYSYFSGESSITIYAGPGDIGTGGLAMIIAGGNISIGATGTIKANGTKGGDGVAGVAQNTGSYYASGGSGGGGSGGGVIAIFHKGVYASSGTLQVNGGLGGAGGAGSVPAMNAHSGTSGAVGTIHIQNLAA